MTVLRQLTLTILLVAASAQPALAQMAPGTAGVVEYQLAAQPRVWVSTPRVAEVPLATSPHASLRTSPSMITPQWSWWWLAWDQSIERLRGWWLR